MKSSLQLLAHRLHEEQPANATNVLADAGSSVGGSVQQTIGQGGHVREHAPRSEVRRVSRTAQDRHRNTCVGGSLTYIDGAVANDIDLRTSACELLCAALESAGVSREMAGLALGVSKTRVDQKCSAQAANAPVTLADVLALIDAGGRPLEAAQSIVDALQSKIDGEQQRSAPGLESLAPLAMSLVATTGGLCEGLGAALVRRSVALADAVELRRRCVSVRRQVSAMSAMLGRIS